MLPYLNLQEFFLYGVRIEVWGLFVALGILTSAFLSYFSFKKKNLDIRYFWDFIFWVIVGAWVGARFTHVFFYDWSYYQNNWLEIFKIWRGGFSSMGGFLGAGLTSIFLFKRFNYNLIHSDVIIKWLPLGWAIGRLGCFLTHLHLGSKTSFFLGIKYLDSIRYELSFFEIILSLLIFLILLIFGRTMERVTGLKTVFVILGYGIFRFLLDFLRANDLPFSDMRYFGLTPAQYGCIILIGVGVYLIMKIKKIRTVTN